MDALTSEAALAIGPAGDWCLTPADHALVGAKSRANRLGFAVHLCCLRFPGYALPSDATPPDEVLAWVAHQLHIDPAVWARYARRPATRWEPTRSK